MQINITPSSGSADFNAYLYPEQNPVNYQWMAAQFDNFSHALTDMGRQIMEESKMAFQRRMDETQRAAKAVVRMSKNIFKPNTIRPLETIDEIRAAESIMQQYVMAHPGLRKLYHQQRCDGYSDSYNDFDPGRIDDNHYHYQRVMSGLGQFRSDEQIALDIEQGKPKQPEWTVVEYGHDDERGDARGMYYGEQLIVEDRLWPVIDREIRAGNDVSDIFGGKLG